MQARNAAVPAVQSLYAVRPAEQSSALPDPLASSPKETTVGDSYLGLPNFTLRSWSHINDTSFLYLSVTDYMMRAIKEMNDSPTFGVRRDHCIECIPVEQIVARVKDGAHLAPRGFDRQDTKS